MYISDERAREINPNFGKVKEPKPKSKRQPVFKVKELEKLVPFDFAVRTPNTAMKELSKQVLPAEKFRRQISKPRLDCSPVYDNIYFIVPENERMVKIGRSIDVQRRLIDLQIGSPVRLRVYASFRVPLSHSVSIEGYLHYAFKKHYLHGEWFKFTAEMKRAVDRGADLIPSEAALNDYLQSRSA
jgi:hypothetical protein